MYKPINEILPMVNPVDFEIAGWDISSENVYQACKRAGVLEPDLIKQMKEELSAIKPMPAALNNDYIASNQADRADNVLVGTN